MSIPKNNFCINFVFLYGDSTADLKFSILLVGYHGGVERQSTGKEMYVAVTNMKKLY